ncbi:MAG: hypothetical protein RLZZ142_284 [Verrucomicrobiota bacterium]
MWGISTRGSGASVGRKSILPGGMRGRRNATKPGVVRSKDPVSEHLSERPNREPSKGGGGRE